MRLGVNNVSNIEEYKLNELKLHPITVICTLFLILSYDMSRI